MDGWIHGLLHWCGQKFQRPSNPTIHSSAAPALGPDHNFQAGSPIPALLLCLLPSALCIFTSGCFRYESPAEVTIINGAEPESLDPAVVTGQPDMRIVHGLFEGLARIDPRTGGPVPGLASGWDISADNCVYTFHLRTNLTWSTGDPIRAGDVVYSWIRALDPRTACDYAGQLFYLKNAEAFNAGRIKDPGLVGVHALDPFTVRVELNHPTAFFLDLCTLPVLSVVPRQTIEKAGDAWLKARPLPVSGPFELDAWRINDKVRLRKNPRYWDAGNTGTGLIDILPVGSPNVALNLYVRGQVDVVWDKGLIPAELLDALLRRPDFHTFDYLGSYFIRFNVTRKPFDDPRVRKALAMAVNKERIVRRITRAGEHPADHFVPDGTARYTPPAGLGFHPDRARQLLAEAGYPGGKGFPRFEYMFNAAAGGGAKVNEKIAVELQQMWREELGVEMDLRQVEWKVLLSAQSHLDYQVSRSSWVGDYNDANTFLDMYVGDSGNNRTGWKNATYDTLVHQANSEPDGEHRQGLLRKAETILVEEDLPIVPLYFYRGIAYYDTNRIQGIYPNIVDEHPLQSIRRSAPSDEGRSQQSSQVQHSTSNIQLATFRER